MRVLMWFLRLLLFFILFGFAVKNDQLASLRFFFGSEWHLPIVFIILIAFAAGALLGVTATFGSLLRQRREISRLRKQLERAGRERAEARPPVAEAQAPETL
ncbi:LapA family protein [Azoarcus sp. L1K30]|uniref:LapA family protein n=1 Tax=Azoarcus sp. L1K30 TaxID=2820277 RepID=UPI001B833373|nr:LapA family protein [Azoarcus sp. L1K30]MBR0566186.1 LapA family protein [Azoarcus sp. L1K30]